MAKIVEFLGHPADGLTLEYFRCHEVFKQRSKEWRALKVTHRCQTEQVQASVTVAANATTATFTVTTSPVGSNTSVTITGVYGATKTATLTVTAATLTSVS